MSSSCLFHVFLYQYVLITATNEATSDSPEIELQSLLQGSETIPNLSLASKMVIIRNPDNVVTLGVSQSNDTTLSAPNNPNTLINGTAGVGHGNNPPPIRDGHLNNNHPPLMGGLEIEGGAPHGDHPHPLGEEEFVPGLDRPRNIIPWLGRRPGVPRWFGNNTPSQHSLTIPSQYGLTI